MTKPRLARRNHRHLSHREKSVKQNQSEYYNKFHKLQFLRSQTRLQHPLLSEKPRRNVQFVHTPCYGQTPCNSKDKCEECKTDSCRVKHEVRQIETGSHGENWRKEQQAQCVPANKEAESCNCCRQKRIYPKQ